MAVMLRASPESTSETAWPGESMQPTQFLATEGFSALAQSSHGQTPGWHLHCPADARHECLMVQKM